MSPRPEYVVSAFRRTTKVAFRWSAIAEALVEGARPDHLRANAVRKFEPSSGPEIDCSREQLDAGAPGAAAALGCGTAGTHRFRTCRRHAAGPRPAADSGLARRVPVCRTRRSARNVRIAVYSWPFCVEEISERHNHLADTSVATASRVSASCVGLGPPYAVSLLPRASQRSQRSLRDPFFGHFVAPRISKTASA